MSVQKEKTLHQKQSSKHPELLESIEECLTGEGKQTVLEFVDYCRANKLSIRWGATYQWYVYLKGKHIASIKLLFQGMRKGRIEEKENACVIHLSYLDAESPEFETFVRNENLSEVIFKNVKYCEKCLPCAPGRDIVILGKPFCNVGNGCGSIWFKNPDAESLECIKKLVEARKGCVIPGIFYR